MHSNIDIVKSNRINYGVGQFFTANFQNTNNFQISRIWGNVGRAFANTRVGTFIFSASRQIRDDTRKARFSRAKSVLSLGNRPEDYHRGLPPFPSLPYLTPSAQHTIGHFGRHDKRRK